MGNKKNVPVEYTVTLLGEEAISVVRYVDEFEYMHNDVSYHAALMCKNGFKYALENGTNIWVPPHRIVQISWNMIEFTH